MLLSEPPRSPYDLRFNVLGIPVRVHPFFWVVVVLLGLRGSPKPEQMLIWVGACFVSILVHELGHALAARAHGWQPWITLHGFGGLASYQPTYRSPRSEILITFAGPGAGFLFAALVVGLIAASGRHVVFDRTFEYAIPFLWQPSYAPAAQRLIFYLLYINIFWGLVNLLPVYPLDGGQIARQVLETISGDGLRQSLWLSVITAVGLAVLALTRLGDQFLAFFFGYLAYTSYAALSNRFGPGGGLGRSR